jgi:hypothetical protein
VLATTLDNVRTRIGTVLGTTLVQRPHCSRHSVRDCLGQTVLVTTLMSLLCVLPVREGADVGPLLRGWTGLLRDRIGNPVLIA